MEVLRSKIHSINESVCPGAGHRCHAFPARPPGIVNLKKKSANARGEGWAMLELTDSRFVSLVYDE